MVQPSVELITPAHSHPKNSLATFSLTLGLYSRIGSMRDCKPLVFISAVAMRGTNNLTPLSYTNPTVGVGVIIFIKL